jgi:putative transcriptional regulator
MTPASLSKSRNFDPDKETKHLVELCLQIPAVPQFTGKNVRALRERYEITQSFLATLLNVSPVTVRQWEGEVRHPNSQCSKLLDILDRKGLHALI